MSKFHAYAIVIGLGLSFSCKHIQDKSSEIKLETGETELEIEKKGYAGENCTCGLNFPRTAFDTWREEIVNSFNDFNAKDKIDFCRGMMSKTYGDIAYFYGAERSSPEALGYVTRNKGVEVVHCGNRQCKGAIGVSFTEDPYGGFGCYFAGEINYIQFGLGVHLCHNAYTTGTTNEDEREKFQHDIAREALGGTEAENLLEEYFSKEAGEEVDLENFIDKLKNSLKNDLVESDKVDEMISELFKISLIAAEKLKYPKSLVKVYIVAHRLTSKKTYVDESTKEEVYIDEIYRNIKGRIDWFNVGWNMIGDGVQNPMSAWTAPRQNREPWKSALLCDGFTRVGSTDPLPSEYLEKLFGNLSTIEYGRD